MVVGTCDVVVVVVVVVVGGEDNKHKVPTNTRHVALILLCLFGCCVILFQVKSCNPVICHTTEYAGSQKVETVLK